MTRSLNGRAHQWWATVDDISDEWLIVVSVACTVSTSSSLSQSLPLSTTLVTDNDDNVESYLANGLMAASVSCTSYPSSSLSESLSLSPFLVTDDDGIADAR
ncbi:hypothetical protein CHS0354_030021 [Potamilus streckersoni]|uniref:Uncharacterized protein n=1 Tax=Potamilus streckersoni TaxID=2493646 RepID=A0AAE0SEG2_9BIVA|nr:hypothetical protein CHS0354_030021 [Potamilus streckersoni]